MMARLVDEHGEHDWKVLGKGIRGSRAKEGGRRKEEGQPPVVLRHHACTGTMKTASLLVQDP